MVVICNAKPSVAIADYLQRWQIGTMFQALKGRGFNMDEMHLRNRDKVSKLLAVLAFCWSYKTEECINERSKLMGEKRKPCFGQVWITSSRSLITLERGLPNPSICFHFSLSLD